MFTSFRFQNITLPVMWPASARTGWRPRSTVGVRMGSLEFHVVQCAMDAVSPSMTRPDHFHNQAVNGGIVFG